LTYNNLKDVRNI